MWLFFICLININYCLCVHPKFGTFHGSGSSVDEMMGFEKSPCEEIKPESLTNILGAAFNPRYMSVVQPQDLNESENPSDNKRTTSIYRPFFVDEDFSQSVDETIPAWEVDHFKSDHFTHGKFKRTSENFLYDIKREKRSAPPWKCNSKIKWIDQGVDYFPRYIRSVECEKHDCWYGRFQCKPKSFTIKLLRRKHGKCAYNNAKKGTQGLPQELKELWVWEERAVNFCCECASL